MSTSHYPDPLIDEVRDRRRQVLASCENNLRKLFEAVRVLEASHPEKIRYLRRSPPAKTNPRL